MDQVCLVWSCSLLRGKEHFLQPPSPGMGQGTPNCMGLSCVCSSELSEPPALPAKPAWSWLLPPSSSGCRCRITVLGVKQHPLIRGKCNLLGKTTQSYNRHLFSQHLCKYVNQILHATVPKMPPGLCPKNNIILLH